MRTPKIRAFLGLSCPHEKLGLLESYGKRLSLLAPENFRRVPRENFHLTTVFLGTQALDSLENMAEEIGQSVELQLPPIDFSTITYFPASKSPKVIAALGQSSPALDNMVSTLTRVAQHHCLNVKASRRSFKPHLSIIRCHSKANLALPKIYEAIDLNLQMDKLVLYESRLKPTGSVYHVLEDWPITPYISE